MLHVGGMHFYPIYQFTGCTVVQRVALQPHSKKVTGSIPRSGMVGLSVWSLHVLPVHAWVLSGYSGFLPQTKNMPTLG